LEVCPECGGKMKPIGEDVIKDELDYEVVVVKKRHHKDNYFGWVTDFELPFTNNLSERSLRGVKSKMKISGQFQSEESAGYYAAIKSYIETCYRNGINEYEALEQLCNGNPYKVAEIIALGENKK